MSTAFHPQTDGQTERVNQTLEQYLRIFCNYQQDNWQQLLPLAEFAYNNSVHASTGQTPFFANYGYHPNSIATSTPRATDSDNPAAGDLIKSLGEVHEQLSFELAEASATHARFYNRKVKEAPPFEEGDQVWLLRRNIKTARPSDKLDHKRLGPFPIKDKVGRAAFRLQLPATMRIHPVFHVSLLEPVQPNDIPGRTQDPAPPVVVDDHEEFEVEEVLDSRVRYGKLQYFVHWKDWPVSSRTWEPKENLANAPDLVDKFHRMYPSKPSQHKPRRRTKARRRSPPKGETYCQKSRHTSTGRSASLHGSSRPHQLSSPIRTSTSCQANGTSRHKQTRVSLPGQANEPSRHKQTCISLSGQANETSRKRQENHADRQQPLFHENSDSYF